MEVVGKEKQTTYAIVDIETTGGNASGSRITEIAIIIHDGRSIVSQWETLVNPEQDIPLPIFALTGINNELVADAPVFDAIAGNVFALLEGKVFVAHNVNFDYSFVKHQLLQAGYEWSAAKLCTVRLSRKLFPGFASYSLGILCHQLGIVLSNRHRAGGDAAATAILFDKLLQQDINGIVPNMLKKVSVEQRLPPNIAVETFNELPCASGVYYFHNQHGKVIYVGKALDIKKRVATHFSGHSTSVQRQHFLRDVCDISYELWATELMALIAECTEIKRLWPIYNSALKRFEAKFGLCVYEAVNGYLYITVGKLAKSQACVQVFNTLQEGNQMLRQWMLEGAIDIRFCKFGHGNTVSKSPVNNVTPLPAIDAHNIAVKTLIDSYLQAQPSYVIMDRGRHEGEKSCIWVENGHLYAMGYIDESTQLNDWAAIKSCLQRYPSNYYIMQLIQAYINNHPGKVRYLDRSYHSSAAISSNYSMQQQAYQANLFNAL